MPSTVKELQDFGFDVLDDHCTKWLKTIRYVEWYRLQVDEYGPVLRKIYVNMCI